ncbi:MAG: DNA alkylation repair protein, partial [Clostridia bacterium]|nr:DNA alkylation repair protein [Clostridia bacterium]
TPKVFQKHKSELLERISVWLESSHTYTVRYAIRMLMRFFLDEDFDENFFEKVSSIKSDEYYIKMMIAWYFATALAKQYDSAVKFIENHILDEDVRKMTIQKAVDSFRITEEQKVYLKTFR